MGNKKGKSDILLKVTRKVSKLWNFAENIGGLLNFYIETQNARHTQSLHLVLYVETKV